MKDFEFPNSAENLKLLPSVDSVLQTETARKTLAQSGAKILTNLIRDAINSLRQEILKNGKIKFSREDLLNEAEKLLQEFWKLRQQTKLQKVINATGVIVHTNLGRAPLSENARRAIAETAAGYCNLEYNLADGKRGKRGAFAEQLLAEITGAENALIVNNCAAAAFLVLTVFAKGGEAIISRGELVEIGGDFRVPDVLEQSGAVLREVGTTNRTKLADYENAINEQTKILMRVHPSNYRIVGFTSAPKLRDLTELAHKNNLIFYEDAGSGALLDLSKYDLADEPVISDSIKAGVDVVTFSGDKLLGGVQSGLIVGRREAIEKLRKHSLYRALRVDKMIYAALEATLESYVRETLPVEIPVLEMISQNEEMIEKRARNFARKLRGKVNGNLQIEIVKGNSVIGGGAAPTVQPATTLLTLRHKKISATQIEEKLRSANPPVIARILEDKVLLDLRTVSKTDESLLLNILADL